LINGAFATVKAISGRQMTIELDREEKEQRRAFTITIGKDRGEIDGISHGYAGTVYKSQGSTLDKTYVLHNPLSSAATSYVALSRHKCDVRPFVSIN
jgi:ATP-dependent exoDNAse (exonuclease V) alpha subunit